MSPADRRGGSDEPLVRPIDEDAPAPPVVREDASSSASTSSPPSSAPSASAPRGSSAPPAGESGRRRARSENMLPQRRRRTWPERMLVRLIATCGIVGIGVAIAAILVSNNTQGWIVGMVVSIVSVVLAALLWSSRML